MNYHTFPVIFVLAYGVWRFVLISWSSEYFWGQISGPEYFFDPSPIGPWGHIQESFWFPLDLRELQIFELEGKGGCHQKNKLLGNGASLTKQMIKMQDSQPKAKITGTLPSMHCARAFSNLHYVISLSSQSKNVTRSGQHEIHRLGRVNMWDPFWYLAHISKYIKIYVSVIILHQTKNRFVAWIVLYPIRPSKLALISALTSDWLHKNVKLALHCGDAYSMDYMESQIKLYSFIRQYRESYGVNTKVLSS